MLEFIRERLNHPQLCSTHTNRYVCLPVSFLTAYILHWIQSSVMGMNKPIDVSGHDCDAVRTPGGLPMVSLSLE